MPKGLLALWSLVRPVDRVRIVALSRLAGGVQAALHVNPNLFELDPSKLELPVARVSALMGWTRRLTG